MGNAGSTSWTLGYYNNNVRLLCGVESLVALSNSQSPSTLVSCCAAAPSKCPSELPNGALWPRSSSGSIKKLDTRGKGSPAGLKIVSAELSYDMVATFFLDEDDRRL